MVLSLPGPVSGLPPRPVSPSVYAHEDRRDQDNDDGHEYPSVGYVSGPVDHDRDTGQHCHAPA